MRKFKIPVISGAALLLAFSLVTMAAAQQRNRARMALRAGIAQMISAGEFLKGLQLTAAQKEEIKAILQAHKAEVLDARKAVLRARLALLNQESNGLSDLAAAQARMMALRQAIFDQIKTKLTPDQLDKLQKRQKNQAGRLENMLKRLESQGSV